MSIKRDVLPLWEHIETEARPKVRFWVPDAAMDKDDLRRQLEQLKARGFGGVEIVTLNTTPKSVSEGPDGWGSANWNEMLRFIAATAGTLGMSVDMANGPMWPISMPTVMSADDPASSKELTWGVLTCPEDGRYTGPLPKRRTIHEVGTPMLVAVMAYRTKDGQTLIQDSYTDLMCCLNDRQDGLDCRLPKAPAGERWLIFSFWCQPTMHKTGDGRFFVVDHLSEAGVQACEAYWAPILKNARDFEAMESIFCDSLEYRSVMEWTPKLPEYFQAWNGYAILPYLPVVGLNVMFPPTDAPEYHFENREISDQINRDYLETLTRCYCELHLAGLERMANRYEKSIRYQVAYNKPFEEERSALYVGIPENEALGRPAMDNLKAMAAAAHLGRKRRYSFECAAEFGNAYGQMYEDLMWWVKRSAIAGMNAQVLHGATYDGGYHGEHSKNGFMEGVKWPGYEAFSKGVSNYWNRTLSETDARGVLDTISRINAVNLKKARVDCAVYRQGYTNDGVGSEFYFYPDDGALMNRGYSYETISTELLKLPVCRVTDGLLDADGPAYKALIIPECSYVSTEFTEKITELMDQGFPVVWVGIKPENARFYREVNTEEKKRRWQLALDKAWEHDAVIHVAVNSQVPEALSDAGILPDVLLEGRMNIATAAHVDAGARIRYYELYGYNKVLCTPDDPNPDEFACSALYYKGSTKSAYERPGLTSRKNIRVSLKGVGAVWQCDPWTGRSERLKFTAVGGRMEGTIAIEEDELVILALKENEEADRTVPCVPVNTRACLNFQTHSRQIPVNLERLTLYEFVPDSRDEKSFLRSHFSDEGKVYELTTLKPWNKMCEALKKFAGKGVYTGYVDVDSIKDNAVYILQLGQVQDTFHLTVNGQPCDFPDQVRKLVDITPQLRNGRNALVIEVVSNLYNRVMTGGQDPMLPFKIPYVEKDYGIWEMEGKPMVLWELA